MLVRNGRKYKIKAERYSFPPFIVFHKQNLCNFVPIDGKSNLDNETLDKLPMRKIEKQKLAANITILDKLP